MTTLIFNFYSERANLFDSAKASLKWARAYSGDATWGRPVENWIQATNSWFKIGKSLDRGLLLLRQATPLDVANFCVATVDGFKAISNKKSDHAKWSLIVLPDSSMRTLNIFKYGSNCLLKTYLLAIAWKDQTFLKKTLAVTYIAIACTGIIKNVFDGYRSSRRIDNAYFNPGIARMLFYSGPLKPLDRNYPVSKLFFIEYLSSDIVCRYLDTIAVLLSLLVFWEEASAVSK